MGISCHTPLNYGLSMTAVGVAILCAQKPAHKPPTCGAY